MCPCGLTGLSESRADDAVLAIARRVLPGTANLVEPDADNVLNLLGPGARSSHARVVVNNAFGFGGINAALVLRALED